MKRKEYVKPNIQSLILSTVGMLAASDTYNIGISSGKAETSKPLLAPNGKGDFDEDELDF